MSQIVYPLRKRIRGKLTATSEDKDPIVNPRLKRFTLGELLEEIVERSAGWNHCAVGERFGITDKYTDSAEKEIMAEGLTQHEANVILEQGRVFEKLCFQAREAYEQIQRIQKAR